jgi:tetratricopeptide (TPR) repeat protein
MAESLRGAAAMKWLPMFLVLLAPAVSAAAAGQSNPQARTLRLEKVDVQPREGRTHPTAQQLADLAEAVDKEPDSREARFALVRGDIDAGNLDAALADARKWRDKDAYNLVVIRLVGDILSEMGRKDEARRTYSSVVELLPHDAEAQRALATVEKQAGDLPGAYERLQVAGELSSSDARMKFELADVAARTGHDAKASELFEAIASDPQAGDAVRYPAKQRLAQIWSADRRAAAASGDSATSEHLAKSIEALGIHGGTSNDVKIYLSWDTDRSDIDLWVTTPSGEKVFYQHKTGKGGEALFDDVTTGYGPESFTAKGAQAGTYVVQVNYFGTRRSQFPEARGEVTVLLHEGSAEEQQFILPYRLFRVGQTVTVGRIHVQ